MIPKAAIDDYLNRTLDSHIWVKRLSLLQVNGALQQLRPVPKLNERLRLHQRASFLLGVSFPQLCFWLDMGVGKSILALELLRYWTQAQVIKRAIIFVTSDKAFPTWERQFKEFGIDLPFVSLAGSSEQKWQQLEEFGDGIVLVPYPGAVAMVCSRVKLTKRKHKLQLDKELVTRLAKWADALVLDESTKASGRDSLTYNLIKQLKKRAKVRYALAGRPFGRDPTMLWTQFNLIDDGETLGETLGMFRAAFFTDKENYWSRNKFAREYKFKESMKPELARMIQHRSITYSADECIDLPKVVPVPEYVLMSEEAKAYYRRCIDDAIASQGNFRETKNNFLRMRQICSGFVGLINDETGERAEIEFQDNPKLERLLELLSDLPENRKAVVFYAYTYSGRRIAERAKELGLKPIWLWSGTKDSRKELARFETDPSCRVAVVNVTLGSMSLDGLQRVANYTFFYESDPSPIMREQAERRLERDGQKLTVFRYDLLVRNSVEERIRYFHQSGTNLFNELIKNPARALGFAD